MIKGIGRLLGAKLRQQHYIGNFFAALCRIEAKLSRSMEKSTVTHPLPFNRW
jgi:hypothetical protein